MGGTVEEEAELDELDCRVVGNEGGVTGGWAREGVGVGRRCRHWRWRGEGDRRLVRGVGGCGGRPTRRGGAAVVARGEKGKLIF